MEMRKHSPGPWQIISGHSAIRILTIEGYDVAQTTGSPYWKEFSKSDEANARLIAAAPDLLEALKALLTAATYAAPPTTKFGEGAGLCYEARIPDQFAIDAQAAIAKAEGAQ
jgi:hypothetical protein